MAVSRSRKPWPDYRAVWRWHFYAGLFCMPFVVLLSLSGAVYLFKAEFEAWSERRFDGLATAGSTTTAADQVRSALKAVPESVFQAYELPVNPTSAVRVLLRHDGETYRTYVHPGTLEVLGVVRESDRLMRQMFRLHGELMLGDAGSHVVELAASWTIVMILTGLVLWWPRNARGLGGVLYPRWHGGRRLFWRDLHGVTGIWISALAMFLLLSGLPWSKFWGDYFKWVRQQTGTAVARQDWTNRTEKGSPPSGSAGGGEHSGHGKRRSGPPATPVDLSPLNQVVAVVAPLNLEAPVLISAPSRGGTGWAAKSMTANRPYRVNLTVNATTGEIVSREAFADRHWIDRIVAVGIAAHEGRLFGWPNQLLGLLTACGLILLSTSGWILWWRRKKAGSLGAPTPAASPRFSLALLMIVVVVAICLPLFGGSLVVVFLLERGLFRQIPAVREWLGLTTHVAT